MPPRLSSHRHGQRRRGGWGLTLAAVLSCALAAALLLQGGLSPFASAPDYTSILVAADTDAGDGFGSSVAVDGRRIAVGAFRDSDIAARAGAAYVLERDGETWREVAKLQAPDTLAGDQAGFSIALRGPWLAVGAVGSFGKHARGSRTGGAVHVFEERGSGWTFVRTLRSPDGRDNDRFGFTVAIDGQRLAIGARGVDADTGAVYLHDLAAPKRPLQRLDAPDASLGDRFGEALAAAAGIIVVGAPGKDGEHEDAGGVYLFAAGEVGVLPGARVATVDPPVPMERGQFGIGVATDGQRVLVGASHWANTDAGGGAWLLEAPAERAARATPARSSTAPPPLSPGPARPLSVAPVATAAMPGFRVALDREYAVVGAHLDDVAAEDAGAVLVYRLPGLDDPAAPTGPAPELFGHRLAADDADAHDLFGIALALDGSTLVVGAEAADPAGKGSGGVYVYSLSRRPPER